MPRARSWGFIAVLFSLILGSIFVHSVFITDTGINNFNSSDLSSINNYTYYAVAIPLGIISLFLTGTGFWIGYTILTIKVVPPMPEIADKKDNSKIKAFILCIAALVLGILFLYGICIKNFWALAIPAAFITLVILGSIFWIGIAIITTRSTLNGKNAGKQS